MKNRILSLILLVALALLSLSSCSILFGKVDRRGVFTVAIDNADGSFEEYSVNLESLENNKEGAKGVLELLDSTHGDFYLEMTDSTYGAYVSAIGSIKESYADNMYVIVYTSVEADSYQGAPTFTFDGVTLYQTGVGLSGMTVKEGGIILFRLEKSPY